MGPDEQTKPSAIGAALRRALTYGSIAAGSAGVTRDRALRGPLYAQIGVVDPCNHRCVMCPYHPPEAATADILPKFGGTRPGLMALETYREAVDDLARLGTRRVDLVGRGEPLLHPDVVEMVAHARTRGLEVAVTTNGSRLSADMVDGLVRAGLDALKVSLNAGRAATYPAIHVSESEDAYRRVLEGIARVGQRAGSEPHLTVSFTISALNAAEIEDMVARAAEVGADAAYFQHLIPVEGRPELSLDAATATRVARDAERAEGDAQRRGLETNLASFAAEAREKGAEADRAETPVPCYAGYYFTAILGNGQVMPCCQIDRSVGDLADDGFAAIWSSEAYRRFRRAGRRLPVMSEPLETAECDRCYFRPHNRSVHALLRPGSSGGRSRISFYEAARLLRLDREGG